MSGSPDPQQNHNLNLRPPGSGDAATLPSGRRGRLLFMVLAMVILLGSTAVVILLLPSYIKEDKRSRVESSAPPSAPPLPDPDPKVSESTKEADENLSNLKAEATEALERFLAVKARAENERVNEWAHQEYRMMLRGETAGDQLFTAQKFREATENYQAATATLESILASKQSRLDSYLTAAAQFLEQEDSLSALRAYEAALVIDPDNKKAQAGALKAQNLDTVLALYQQAQEDEASGDLNAAAQRLEELLQLDETYLPAIEAYNHLLEILEQRAFEQSMRSFYDDLQRGTLGKARKTLDELKKTHPTHDEVTQAEELLVQKEEVAWVNDLKTQADTHASKEEWSKALSVYEQVLKVQPGVLFALHGRERAVKRLDLDNNLKTFLENPERFGEMTQITSAQKLLAYARSFSKDIARLSDQIDELDKLIKRATTLVPVTIESDELTEVVIYHVGKLGVFSSKKLTLRPGRYTVVGSRNGYRDIRAMIEVDPEAETNQFYIACREPI